MESVRKSRRLWIVGLVLVFIGVLFHSHAELWATDVVTTDLSSTGKMSVINRPLARLCEDGGVAIMVLGAISFTLGLVGWLYPPSRSEIVP